MKKKIANHSCIRFHPVCSVRLLGKTEFPTYMAVKCRFTIMMKTDRHFKYDVWQWFLDGHEAAIILN